MAQDPKAALAQAEFQQIVSQGAGAMSAAHGYSRGDDPSAPGAVALTPQDEAQLHQLLLERVFAKRLRNFAAADELRAAVRDIGSRQLVLPGDFIEPAKGNCVDLSQHAIVGGDRLTTITRGELAGPIGVNIPAMGNFHV